jgi:hypothetical protein
LKNNYQIICNDNSSSVRAIDIIIDSQTEECECDFTQSLLVFESVCDDDEKRNVYVNPNSIVAIAPIRYIAIAPTEISPV